MKLLIDTNILLDVFQDREPHATNSSLIWKMCETGLAHGIVCSFTFLNLVYIMRKQLEPSSIKNVLDRLCLIFDFADLQKTDIKHAAALEWNDFEDAVQFVTAKRLHADYIITRNTDDYASSSIPALDPGSFIKWYAD